MGHKGHSTGNISGVGLARDVEEIGTHVDAGHEEVKGIGKNGHFRGMAVAVDGRLEGGNIVHPNHHVAAPQKMGEGKDGRHESEELALVGPLLLGEG